MKPKKGDMTFENNWQYTSFVRWNVDVDGCDFSNIKLATPEHLASMGLVTQAEYDALQTRYLDLVTEVEKLREFAYEQEDKKPEPAKEPQPTHRFKVGDKVKIVRSTPWRSGKSGEHTECVGCTGTLKQPSMRIIDFDVELDEKHDGLLTAGCMSADLELIEAAPQPHVWSVGDYALEEHTEKVKRVIDMDEQCLGFHDNTWEGKDYCTPCAEPGVPELPPDFTRDGSRLVHAGQTWMSLNAWIVAMQEDPQSWLSGQLKSLIALRDWRVLTGRMV